MYFLYTTVFLVDRINQLLISLGVLSDFGAMMSHYMIGYIPEANSIPKGSGYIQGMGVEKRHCHPIASGKLPKIMEAIKDSERLEKVAEGLNRSRMEPLPTGRLAFLWAAAQEAFDTGSTPLLSDEERSILASKVPEVIANSSDERSSRLIQLLMTPDLLKAEGISKRMAKPISELLGISSDEVARLITKAGKFRGKSLHSVSSGDLREAEESSIFLENALMVYINRYLQ